MHAIEVYDSGNAWFAHLALALQITHFETGKILWTFSYDNRKEVQTQNFAVSVRALSELVSDALERALVSMERMHTPDSLPAEDPPSPIHDVIPTSDPDTPPKRSVAPAPPSHTQRDPHEPILVPEPPAKADDDDDDASSP